MSREKLNVLLILVLVLLAAAGITAWLTHGDAEEPVETPAPIQSTEPVTPVETTQPISSTVLPETPDAGQEYIDKMVFIGDSTTYGLKFYGVLSGGENTDQVWTPSSGTLALFNQSFATIVYPKTGAEIPITDAVADAQPEYLVLTIGVNGVSMMDETAFKADYTALVERIQSVSPNTKIICNSIYPVESVYEAKDNGINNAKINAANLWIQDVAAATGSYYTDSASVLKGEDGCLVPAYGNGDGIHLCADGFNLVLEYLRTHAL